MWQLKTLARREARAARAGNQTEEAVRRSLVICGRIAAHPRFASASRVVLYFALPGEVETSSLREVALAAGKRIFFPGAVDRRLDFLEDVDGKFQLGRWGIREPISSVTLPDGPGTTAVVPGLLFDTRGVRLGRGAGLYDRALAKHSSIFRIGVAYEAQLTPILPRESWDVAMDVVVSDRRLFSVERKGNSLKEMA